jgi:hypothetical protein
VSEVRDEHPRGEVGELAAFGSVVIRSRAAVQHRHARGAGAQAGGLGLDEVVAEVVRGFLAVVFDEVGGRIG